MQRILVVGNETSTARNVIPFVRQQLSEAGFALLHMKDTSEKLETDMLILSSLVGAELGENVGYHVIEAEGSPDQLELHTEGISNSSGIIPCFALGCLIPSVTGGQTRILDGKMAADILNSRHPEIARTVIEYTSRANPGQQAVYPIVIDDKECGRVLRYRSRVVTNTIRERAFGISEDSIYETVDQVLSECVALCHSWERGDLLFVNNRTTLHDRLPFMGKRKMLRVRFGDLINRRIQY